MDFYLTPCPDQKYLSPFMKRGELLMLSTCPALMQMFNSEETVRWNTVLWNPETQMLLSWAKIYPAPSSGNANLRMNRTTIKLYISNLGPDVMRQWTPVLSILFIPLLSRITITWCIYIGMNTPICFNVTNSLLSSWNVMAGYTVELVYFLCCFLGQCCPVF